MAKSRNYVSCEVHGKGITVPYRGAGSMYRYVSVGMSKGKHKEECPLCRKERRLQEKETIST